MTDVIVAAGEDLAARAEIPTRTLGIATVKADAYG
jgi:hypothetical protein